MDLTGTICDSTPPALSVVTASSMMSGPCGKFMLQTVQFLLVLWLRVYCTADGVLPITGVGFKCNPGPGTLSCNHCKAVDDLADAVYTAHWHKDCVLKRLEASAPLAAMLPACRNN